MGSPVAKKELRAAAVREARPEVDVRWLPVMVATVPPLLRPRSMTNPPAGGKGGGLRRCSFLVVKKHPHQKPNPDVRIANCHRSIKPGLELLPGVDCLIRRRRGMAKKVSHWVFELGRDRLVPSRLAPRPPSFFLHHSRLQRSPRRNKLRDCGHAVDCVAVVTSQKQHTHTHAHPCNSNVVRKSGRRRRPAVFPDRI